MARKSRSRAESAPIEEHSNPIAAPLVKLLIADAALSAGTHLLRDLIDRRWLGGARPAPGSAKAGAAAKAAKLASRSLPVAGVIGAGLLAKNLFDRAGKRRKAKSPTEE